MKHFYFLCRKNLLLILSVAFWFTTTSLNFVDLENLSEELVLDSSTTSLPNSLTTSSNATFSFQGPCGSLSTLDCDEVSVRLPVDLNLRGSEGKIYNTGFTMVAPPSSILSEDGNSADPNVPGLKTNNLYFSNGNLYVKATRGTNYNNGSANSQMNALGVGFDVSSNVINISSTIEQPHYEWSYARNQQHAGIWFGKNENNFARLVVVKRSRTYERIQLAVEDQINGGVQIFETNSFRISSVSQIRFRLSIDPSTNEIRAYYRLDNDQEVLLRDSNKDFIRVSDSFFLGTDHDNTSNSKNLNFAGILNSKNGSNEGDINVGFDSFSITEEVVESNQNDILSFSFLEQTGNASINTSEHTIDIEVDSSADLTALVPTITLSEGASVNPASGIARNFTSPVNYIVTAEDDSEQNWVVNVSQKIALSSDNDILSFSLVEQTAGASIDTESHTINIEVNSSADLTALVPTITLSEGASVNPASGIAMNFTDPVNYIVTAEDGSEQNWVVTVSQQIALSSDNDVLSFSLVEQTAAASIDTESHTINIEVNSSADLTSLVPTITLSEGASVNPSSGTALNFTNPVNYAVTAEDGTAQSWIVTITFAEEATHEVMRFNIAGNAYTKNGDLYEAENLSFLEERQSTTTSTGAYSPYLITGHQQLYYSRRFGADFGYKFPVINGRYTVILHMIENYWTAANARVFDVSIEDNLKLDDLDLFASYGKGVLAELSFDIEVEDNELNIDFLSSVNNAIIQAIEILPYQETLSSENDILTFSLNEQSNPAVINTEAHTVDIEVLEGTSLTALTPELNISENASVTPLNGTEQDFTNSVIYTVRAENGSQQDWTINVSVQELSQNLAPIITDQIFTIDEDILINSTVGSISANDPDGDALAYTIIGGNDEGVFSINVSTGELRTEKILNYDVSQEYNLTIAASDGSLSASSNILISINEVITNVVCSPYSILDCEDLELSLPVNLDFTQNNAGLSESGLTMALPPSSRIDTPIFNLDASGYEPSLVSRTNEGLNIRSTKGIFYSQLPSQGTPSSANTNSQINALGVGFKVSTATFNIVSSLQNPDFTISAGTSSQQAGIWFGIDEDHYVKLAIIKTSASGRNIQLQIENMDNSTKSTAFLELNSPDISSNTGDIQLRLAFDPVSNTVKAFYTLSDGDEVAVVDVLSGQSELSVPSAYFEGTSYTSSNSNDKLSFAGIYTTHRNAAVNDAINVLFKDFKINTDELKINFSSSELIFNGILGEEIGSQQITVSATMGNPSFSLSDDPDSSDWLIMPAAAEGNSLDLGNLQFGIKENLPAGIYSTTVFAIDESDLGYDNGQLSVSLNIIDDSENQAPTLNDQSFVVSEDITIGDEVGNIVAIDFENDNLFYEIILGNDLEIFEIDENTGILSVVKNLDFDQAETYQLTVKVSDGDKSSTALVIVHVERPLIPCTPLSTLNCDEVIQNLPLALSFNGNEAGIIDANASGTGFTMVAEYSQERFDQDMPATQAVIGYEPSKINISGDNLELTASKGIAYRNINNQINTLGIGLQSLLTPIVIETKLLDINMGAGYAQQGLWFGIDEDNFVKLDVFNTSSIEMRKEEKGITSNGMNTEDQLQVSNILRSGDDVMLRLVIDPVDQIISGYYSINDGVIYQVGTATLTSLVLPQSYIDGTDLNDNISGVSFAGIYATYRNGSSFKAMYDYFTVDTAVDQPYFINVTPGNEEVRVPLADFQVNVEIITPDGYELDKATIAGNVNLYELAGDTGILIPSNSNDTGGGDAITLTPIAEVKELTQYVFRIDGVEANKIGDPSERISFAKFESRFTTGNIDDEVIPVRELTGVSFTKVLGGSALGPGTINERFSSLAVGPDGKLYASTIGDFQSDGKIFRWNIEEDGTLSNLQVLSPNLEGSPHPNGTPRDNNNRLIIGFVFDPASTADNLIAYVTHSMAAVTDGPEWDGKLTRLSGENLETVQDLIIHLPRSQKDHLTNSMTFDDAGYMYISQGSNSAGGDPDEVWGYRPERLLSAAILKLDLNKLPSSLPLSAYTTSNIDYINAAPLSSIQMEDGTYNPYATNSPLTIFATGIRNAYDLMWHSNGWLYIPTNGTAGNSLNSPNSPSTENYTLAKRPDGNTSIPYIPGLSGGETQKDWLFKTNGERVTYHGHPNPYRGEFILNHGGKAYGGLPGQSETLYTDVSKYPDNLGPDPNYMEPAYDFGKNKSPNGVLEYKSDTFGGKLKGLMMVVRFSGQDDLLVMDPKNDGDIAEVYRDIPGLNGFDDPLDVIEDPSNGNIYISEYDRDNNGIARLTLLRATDLTDEDNLVLAFDKAELNYAGSTILGEVASQQIILSAVGNINAGDVNLQASESWVQLPENFDMGSPLAINIDLEGLEIGSYQATVTATSPNYQSASFLVNLVIANTNVYTYQFNFQSPTNVEISPEGYIDDIGKGYDSQSTDQGEVFFGWVRPGTTTPADGSVNSRNRASIEDPLLKTHNNIGHRVSENYPTLDWLVNVPNGEYLVDISVGDPDYSDSHHVLDVNGVTIIDFDQENNNPENLSFYNSSGHVTISDGLLRLSLGEGGVNSKINYLRLAPLSPQLLGPTITASFEGISSGLDLYVGSVNIALEAEDESGSDEIVRLEYKLDDNPIETYVATLNITEIGEHSLLAIAEDGNGNVTEKIYQFTVLDETGAKLFVENMTKIPVANRSFPADDYYTFYRLGNPGEARFLDSNIMRLRNTGTGNLLITDVVISDLNDFTYQIVPRNGQSNNLPLTIAPGDYRDLNIQFIGTTGTGSNGMFKENLEIFSNADNGLEAGKAILHGGYAPQPEGGDEINAQEVIDAFGFKTSILSIVNDNGTITPPNPVPYSPSDNYPTAENINLGYEGDLVLSSNFVQADPSKPVVGVQLGAFSSPGEAGAKFIRVNGNNTVANMNFNHASEYYSTLRPLGNNNSDLVNYDSANSISEPFRIQLAYYNTGGTGFSNGQPTMLGVRLYKVRDRDGNIVPNEYIAIEDFIGSGCGIGSSNCDWNDNVFYFINIRPQPQPSANPIDTYVASLETPFDYSINGFFELGYPGNKLNYSATVQNSNLPSWMSIDSVTGVISGTPPADADNSYRITVKATDLNGLEVSSSFTLSIDRALIANDDFASTPQNTAIVLDQLLNNDIELNNEDLNITQVSTPINGSASINGAAITYTPDSDYIGTDTFIYTVQNESGLLDTATVTVTITDPASTSDFALRINSGGPQVEYEGNTFMEDTYFSGGNGYTNNQANVPTLYKSERTSNPPTFSYNIPLEDGEYEVVLHFAEIYHGVNGGGSSSGRRVFDVNIEGNRVLNNYNITSDVGAGNPVTKTFDIQVTDGTLNIYFSALSNVGGVDQPKLSALEILGTNLSNTKPTAVVSASVLQGEAPLQVNFSGSDSYDDGGIVNYLWNFKDGSTSNAINPTHTFNNPGNYEVTLQVTDQGGLTDLASINIEVDESLGCVSLPNPWSNRDIGNVGASGSVCYENGSFTVEASGSDIWNNADEFHFVYQELRGNGEIIAELRGLEDTNDWAKAGLMMRDNLNANSRFAQMVISPNPDNIGGAGYTFQIRGYNGTNTSDSRRVPGGIPHYLRLVRSGDYFIGYVSDRNGDWDAVAYSSIPMGQTIYVGLATTSHNDGVLTTASYGDVSINGVTSRASVSVDNGIYIDNKESSLSTNALNIADFNVTMYPNPTQSDVNIRINDPSINLEQILVYDIRGRLTKEFKAENVQINNEYKLPLENLQSGIYIVNLITEDGIIKKLRLSIQN